ncbi:uncharacterized protein Z520_01578 [Fonsecaea multimorphosa CBS 102226]|uniref:Uncharacterized protein n=1 Tax=Fonsecaea multimorphosa CBS 102226 TaxID=1442371 RepID=A0A0D2HMK6_9EURO|nr:uncharacterized protein Z520_01578 [Fonsecaea multimorphosa CBS 102226]KIY03111.1 hypothetical protein Z520_01578 [Fonsecaea multimorphosa CBS 102226]OAL30358.1 hypothetical protein AYO22_01556 [Fonsecaea multimorphosa]
MPLSMMEPLSRPPSRDLTPTRRLSREETYHLADTARRKSSDKFVREDLRLKLSHDHLLELLLQDIARTERERQTSPTDEKYLMPQERKRPAASSSPEAQTDLVDEYGFPLDLEDGEEDLGGLSLTRTPSRRPAR